VTTIKSRETADFLDGKVDYPASQHAAVLPMVRRQTHPRGEQDVDCGAQV
jgi:hypothetical protein